MIFTNFDVTTSSSIFIIFDLVSVWSDVSHSAGRSRGRSENDAGDKRERGVRGLGGERRQRKIPRERERERERERKKLFEEVKTRYRLR